MALQKSTRAIGAYTYEVTQIDAVQGRRVIARLAKVAGPLIGEISASGASSMGAALGRLVEGLDADLVDFLCDTFAKSTTVSGPDFGDGKSPRLDNVFATHFAGRYWEMGEWLVECLTVNFGSFFDALGVRVAGAPGARKAE